MKKWLPIIIGGVIVLILVGGGWLYLRSRKNDEVGLPPKETAPFTEEPAGGEESMSITGKLEDLISLGQAVKCTWQDVQNNTGTSYVKGDKVYTESTVNGQTNYAILRDNCTYVWQESQPQGYKMCVDPEDIQDESAESETELPQGFSVGNETVGYTCVPQIINDSRFDLPSGVEFINPMEMMPADMPALMGN